MIPVKTLFISLASLGVFVGCTVGPDYERPKVEVPNAWRADYSISSADADKPQCSLTDATQCEWWKVFGDSELDRLVNIALEENKDLLIAASRIEEYRAMFVVTDSDRYPTLDVSGSISRQQMSQRIASFSMPYPINNKQLALNLGFELDLWGKYRRASEAARAQLLATQYARDTVRLTLISNVVQAYLQLRTLDAQLQRTEQTLTTRKEAYDLQEKRFKEGLISELELRQAEVEYRSTAALIPSLQQQIQQTENGLSVLLGRNPGTIARGLSIGEMSPFPDIPVGLPSELLARRPDIRQAEEQLVAANAQIGVAKAAYFPTISLTGIFGTQSAALDNLFTGPSKTWQWAGNLGMPIFNAGRIGANVDIATERQKQALYTYQQAIQTAFREVDDALIANQKLQEQYQAQLQQYEATQKLLKIAQLRYQYGYVSYLDVLDAQRNLYNVEITIINTQSAKLSALVALNKALGGGWVDGNPEPSSSSTNGVETSSTTNLTPPSSEPAAKS